MVVTLSAPTGVRELPDGDLVAQIADADRAQECFAELIGRHGPMVVASCRRMLGNDADADDASQAVFLVLWKKSASLRNRNSVAAWLHGVARNVCRSALRARAARSRHEEAAARQENPAHPPDRGEWNEIREILDQELGALPEKYREPIVLFHLEDRSLEEVAEILKTKPSTVGTRLARGREKLRARMIRKRELLFGATALGSLISANSASASATAVPASLTAACSQIAAGGTVSASAAALAKTAGPAIAAIHSHTVATMAAAALVAGGTVAVVQLNRPEPPPVLPAAPEAAESLRPASYAEFVPVTRYPSLAQAIRQERFIFLPPGEYDLPETLELDRDTPLFIHGRDAETVRIRGGTFDVRATPLFSLAGITLEGVDLRFHNEEAVETEILESQLDWSRLEIGGPGRFRFKEVEFLIHPESGGGVVLDHPRADCEIYRGSLKSKSPDRFDQNRYQGYAHLVQKRGRFRLNGMETGEGRGLADFRFEAGSGLGPHIVTNVKSQGNAGIGSRSGSPYVLLHVPPTAEEVDVIVKNNTLTWPGPSANSSFVKFGGSGTLFLADNDGTHSAARLLHGDAPEASVIALRNILARKPDDEEAKVTTFVSERNWSDRDRRYLDSVGDPELHPVPDLDLPRTLLSRPRGKPPGE